MRRRAIVLAAPAALAGCISVDVGTGKAPAHLRYVLDDPGAAAPVAAAAPLIDALAVQSVAGDPLADSAAIVYARSERERATYALSSWTDRPSHRIAGLLRRRLERTGTFGAIVELGRPAGTRWLLTVGVDAVHHDLRSEPGQGVVQLTAALFDHRSRTRVATREFRATEAAAQANAESATAAIGVATGRVFDALLPWLEAALRRELAARPA
jgi:ABC-type uncharacterized transport system auxiliary subunit